LLGDELPLRDPQSLAAVAFGDASSNTTRTRAPIFTGVRIGAVHVADEIHAGRIVERY
jgi:hypothetical protein